MTMRVAKYFSIIYSFITIFVFLIFLIILQFAEKPGQKEIYINTGSPNSAKVREVIRLDKNKRLVLLEIPQVHQFNKIFNATDVSEISVRERSDKELRKLVLPFSNKKVLVINSTSSEFFTTTYRLAHWGELTDGTSDQVYSLNQNSLESLKIHETFENGYVQEILCEPAANCRSNKTDQEAVFIFSSLNTDANAYTQVIWNREYTSSLVKTGNTLTLIKVYYFNVIVVLLLLTAVSKIVLYMSARYKIVVRKKTN